MGLPKIIIDKQISGHCLRQLADKWKTAESNKEVSLKIYVGNLSYEVTEQDLRQEFEAFGAVDTVSVIMDKFSGRSKGFAFIEMASKPESEAAITGLNGKQLKERTLTVNEARPKVDNRAGGGSYNDRRGGESRGGGRQQQRRY